MADQQTYYLKNFNNTCCYKWLSHCLSLHRIEVFQITAGKVITRSDDRKKTEFAIQEAGFVILKDKNLIALENIKQAVFELVQLQSNQSSIIQKSEYLIEKLNMSYPQISRIFNKYMSITLEKYIIKHKIEKIKEMIDDDSYSLSEIAYIMDYSSVAHLSAQFKKETELTVSDYKALDVKPREDLSLL
ncbi:MAG: helix-turn-helix transcriptional regulator [Bacteroidales bacterium]|nr:helix-turn-helix transcriptional regulator [Bacteroidales bacterium]